MSKKIKIPIELYERLEKRALKENKTVDQLVEELTYEFIKECEAGGKAL